jgi:hypothetical protein
MRLFYELGSKTCSLIVVERDVGLLTILLVDYAINNSSVWSYTSPVYSVRDSISSSSNDA